jgi:hypothetical protein
MPPLRKPAPQGGKMRLRLIVTRTRFGDPHPQTLSLACGAFFVITIALSDGFLREGIGARTAFVNSPARQVERPYSCSVTVPHALSGFGSSPNRP